MADVKMTKTEKITAIRAILVEAGADETLLEECDAQLEQLAKRAERAAAKRAEKKAEEDPFMGMILEVIGDEYVTADDVLAALSDVEDLTIAKIRTRLTALTKNGSLEKTDLMVGEGKTKKGYKLA